MRLVFISYEYPPLKTPQSIRWNEILKRIAGEEIEVFTITNNVNHGSKYYDPNFRSGFEKLVLRKGFYSGQKKSYNDKELSSSASYTLYSQVKKELKKYIPFDKSIVWAFLSLKSTLREIERIKPDIVISSAPPFGSLILGILVKKITKIQYKWVIDLGDPWSFASDRVWTKLSRTIVEYLERQIFSTANSIFLTTKSTLEKYKKLSLIPNDVNVHIIYQAANIRDNSELISKVKESFVYTGTFYENIREPFNLYDACYRAQTKLLIAGPIGENFFPQKERELPYISMLGNLCQEDAIKLQYSAKALVFIDNTNSTQLPGKIFEYLLTGLPILCIGTSSQSPLKEIDINDYPIVFCENTPESIELGIKEIEQKEKCSSNLLFDFTWEKRVQQVKAILNDMIN